MVRGEEGERLKGMDYACRPRRASFSYFFNLSRLRGKREWWEVEEVSFQDVRGEVRRIKRDARTKCQKS